MTFSRTRVAFLSVCAPILAATMLYACSSTDANPGAFPEPPIVPPFNDGATPAKIDASPTYADASDGGVTGLS